MNNRRLISILSFLLILVQASAQVTIEGRVFDFVNSKPIADASISVKGRQDGVISGTNGSFKLQTHETNGTIQIAHVSYKTIEINFKAKNQESIQLGNIFLEPAWHSLGTVDILAFRAEEGKSAIAVANIGRKEITQYNTGLSYPELMRNIPGLYASRLGGGVGDAAINIRGFKQENLALTLNGIPIGSVENGLVYWSNWDGLQEATQSIQVQKGIGNSELVSNSLGGTINISTHATETEEGGQVSYYTTDYGLHRTSLRISSGSLSNGWRLSFAGSRTTGQGYAQGTEVQAWSYFLFAEKNLNANHRLLFSLLGSPERHGQRSTKLSYQDIQAKGLKYNPDWGTYEGRPTSLMENFYHKPLLTISHYWTINEKSQLATSFYASYGYGGGNWVENYSGPTVFSFKTLSGQIDWNAIAQNNASHGQIYLSPDGDTLRNFSLNARSLFLASHYWAGLISVYNHKISERLTLRTGIHTRHFKSWLWEEIDDLMGGNYFIDDYAWAFEGVAGRNIMKFKGDKVRIDNGAIVELASVFAKAEYQYNDLKATISAGTNLNTYQREDRYNYPSHPSSEKLNRQGGEFKSGLSYGLSPTSIIFFNAGFISRAPYHKFVFPNFNNNPANGLRNEKIFPLEVGLGGKIAQLKYNLNAYFIRWDDKSLLSNEYLLIDNRTTTRAMVSGLGAKHKGIEAELGYCNEQIGFTLGAQFSVGKWTWRNNVNALLFNNENELIDTVRVYADGLYVGDAPQMQVGVFVGKNIPGGITLYSSYLWYDRFYADFDPSTRTQPEEGQPFRIPSFGLWDARLGYKTLIFGKLSELSFACSNILNKAYVLRGDDGPGHDKGSFRGYWGPKRNFHFTLRVNI